MVSKFESLRTRLATFLNHVPEGERFYSSHQMEQIEEPMKRIVQKLWPHIKNAEYSLIVSDDMSGRIPTLVWRNLIDRVYEKKGIEPIIVAFVKREKRDAIRIETIKVLQKFALEAQRRRPNTRALISTEHMGDGIHVQDIAYFLDDVSIPYDVVSVSTLEPPSEYKPLLNAEARIFSGARWQSCPIADLMPWELDGARMDVAKMAQVLLGSVQLFSPQAASK